MRDILRMRIEKRIEAHQKGYRQNVGLIGRAGLGKTRLLAELYRSLSLPSSQISVYIDARAVDYEHFAERWLGALLVGLLKSLAQEVPATFQGLLAAAGLVPKTAERIRHLKKLMRQEKTASSVRGLFSIPNLLAEETGKKVILMIDNFQALEALPVPDPFGILGKEIMVDKNVLYLVTSSSPARAREIFREKLSLLFGNFEVIELAPLGFEETADFLGKQLEGRSLTGSQKRFFMRMTDGIPLYLELLTEGLRPRLSENPRDVPSEEIVEVFHHELFSRKGRLYSLFENRLEAFRRLAKESSSCLKALVAISCGRRRVSAIAAAIGKKTRETQKILQRLAQEGGVTPCGSFYLLEDPLFRFWLREVFQKLQESYGPDPSLRSRGLLQALSTEMAAAETEETVDITGRVEALFKEFHNDVIEMDERKWRCPQFSEIVFRPTNGRFFPLLARGSKERWLCQVTRERVCEEDLHLFLDEWKRMRRKVGRRILIALGGIDQNAKLVAQEAGIQLWDLRFFNALLDLYDLPKIILLSEKESQYHEPTVGALAQSLSPA